MFFNTEKSKILFKKNSYLETRENILNESYFKERQLISNDKVHEGSVLKTRKVSSQIKELNSMIYTYSAKLKILENESNNSTRIKSGKSEVSMKLSKSVRSGKKINIIKSSKCNDLNKLQQQSLSLDKKLPKVIAIISDYLPTAPSTINSIKQECFQKNEIQVKNFVSNTNFYQLKIHEDENKKINNKNIHNFKREFIDKPRPLFQSNKLVRNNIMILKDKIKEETLQKKKISDSEKKIVKFSLEQLKIKNFENLKKKIETDNIKNDNLLRNKMKIFKNIKSKFTIEARSLLK